MDLSTRTYVEQAYQHMDTYLASDDATPADMVNLSLARATLALQVEGVKDMREIERNLEYIFNQMTKTSYRL